MSTNNKRTFLVLNKNKNWKYCKKKTCFQWKCRAFDNHILYKITRTIDVSLSHKKSSKNPNHWCRVLIEFASNLKPSKNEKHQLSSSSSLWCQFVNHNFPFFFHSARLNGGGIHSDIHEDSLDNLFLVVLLHQLEIRLILIACNNSENGKRVEAIKISPETHKSRGEREPDEETLVYESLNGRNENLLRQH